MNRIPFLIRTNQEVLTDEDGKEYIIHPVTKEKLYRFIPALIDNPCNEIMLPMNTIEGLHPRLPRER